MIGVLGLQGSYQMHSNILSAIGINSILVKSEFDLKQCEGLIIPGGESTTISKLMVRYGLIDPIKNFAEKRSVFGTCAGLILMSSYDNDNIESLNILEDVEILRNGWGRQINSFTKNVDIKIKSNIEKFRATFIRAPKIEKVTNSTNIISSIDNNPIMIRQGIHIGTTFHPEMHGDPLVHKYFANIVYE